MNTEFIKENTEHNKLLSAGTGRIEQYLYFRKLVFSVNRAVCCII